MPWSSTGRFTNDQLEHFSYFGHVDGDEIIALEAQLTDISIDARTWALRLAGHLATFEDLFLDTHGRSVHPDDRLLRRNRCLSHSTPHPNRDAQSFRRRAYAKAEELRRTRPPAPVARPAGLAALVRDVSHVLGDLPWLALGAHQHVHRRQRGAFSGTRRHMTTGLSCARNAP